MSEGELIPRGRKIGVRVYLNGKREWLGTVTRSCEKCDGAREMCRSCRAQAELDCEARIDKAKRRQVFKRERCSEFAGRWTTDYSHGGKRWDASTLRVYADALRTFKDHFGHRAMADVDASEARSWSNTVPASYVRCIRAMFNDATRDDLIARNPFTGIKLSAAGRSQIVAITEDELQLLCSLAHDAHGKHGPTVAAMVAVAGYTGIRPGELFALEPDCFRGDELDVRWQWTGHEWKRPKTKEPRTIALPPECGPFLAKLPRYLGQIKVAREDGETLMVDPAFRNKKRRLYRQSAFNLTWQPVRTAFEAKLSSARVRELRDARDGAAMDWYELRHFAATEILRRGGTLDDVAHQLGHAKGSKATLIYTHLEESYKVERVKRLYGTNVRDFKAIDDDAEEAAG